MAQKGQEFKKYPEEFKLKVVIEYLSGKTSRGYLSKQYNIPSGTISTWSEKYKRQGNLNNNSKLRGRRKEKDIDYKERYEILKKYQAFLKAQRERK